MSHTSNRITLFFVVLLVWNNFFLFMTFYLSLPLLVNYHKFWSVEKQEDPPSTTVMGGNKGGNAGIGEFVSTVLEPAADKMKQKSTTGGLYNGIETLNEDLEKEWKQRIVSRLKSHGFTKHIGRASKSWYPGY